ncbi:MAG: hypothetical protein JHC84_15225 [Solirubrobacteraceae bacterium]|nr:hypothetical protein [Solirubrobacteraceae bacterium]
MIRKYYGASPLHLAGHLLAIAVAAFAFSKILDPVFAPFPLNLALWFVGGALIHDLVLLPAYSAVDGAARRVLPADVLNHVRFPAAISGVTLLVYFPLILERQPQNFERALGEAPPDYLARWLWFTLALFVASGVVLAVRRLTGSRAAAARRPAP